MVIVACQADTSIPRTRCADAGAGAVKITAAATSKVRVAFQLRGDNKLVQRAFLRTGACFMSVKGQRSNCPALGQEKAGGGVRNCILWSVDSSMLWQPNQFDTLVLRILDVRQDTWTILKGLEESPSQSGLNKAIEDTIVSRVDIDTHLVGGD